MDSALPCAGSTPEKKVCRKHSAPQMESSHATQAHEGDTAWATCDTAKTAGELVLAKAALGEVTF